MTSTRAGRLLLDRYREVDLLAMFAEAGVLEAVEKRGFADLALRLEEGGGPLPHTRLYGRRDGHEHLLLDTCLSDAIVDEGSAARCGYAGPLPLRLLVVYWLREQDPTRKFDATHPRLPLQEHPGLGVLRRAFRVALAIAKDEDRHGIAALPKFFHDASIFWHSRLFLFLDPREQGRFEALLRDLEGLPLAEASVALAAGAVRDADGHPVSWQAGFQVMPLLPPLTEWFHSPAYQRTSRLEVERRRYVVDRTALTAGLEVFGGGPT